MALSRQRYNDVEEAHEAKCYGDAKLKSVEEL